MPADLENMFYGGAVPWHGMGTFIPEDKQLSALEAEELAGANWDVVTRPLVTVQEAQKMIDKVISSFAEGNGVDSLTVEANVDARAIVRSDTGAILGSCGSRWTPLQNRAMFEWFQPFLDAGVAEFHTGGVLSGGAKVWALAHVTGDPIEIRKDDPIERFILLSNHHDGKTSVRVGFTPIRVVCANTLAMAYHSSQSKLIRVRHSKDVKANIIAIRDIMDAVNADFVATAQQYQLLASRQISIADLKKYVKILFDCENLPDDKIPTRRKNQMQEVIALAEQGRGNNGSTYWDAYNGFTEYVNYQYGRSQNNRLNALWFGTNQNASAKALQTAMTLAV